MRQGEGVARLVGWRGDRQLNLISSELRQEVLP
jgi:hypothetical protein